ncbi:hypothetical protein BGX27_010871 [Mortierella sp. AM989]|nr:hypothetical protein BGX27_010871 [Mortierella sp. AM989]
MRCFNKAQDSPHLSNRILHRWPTPNHRDFEFRWASSYVQKKVYKRLDEQSWESHLEGLVLERKSGGRCFEEFVTHIFRVGGHTFEIKDLENATTSQLNIPRKPSIKTIHGIPDLSSLAHRSKTLYLPDSLTFPCVDMALGPNMLFQVTLRQKHESKQAEFGDIIKTITEGTSKPDELDDATGESDDATSEDEATCESDDATSEDEVTSEDEATSEVENEATSKVENEATSKVDEPNDANRTDDTNELRIYFLVPPEKYDKYKLQKFLTNKGKVSRRSPKSIKKVRQFALKFDFKKSWEGKSPGIDTRQ